MSFAAEGAEVIIADIVPEPLEGGESTLARILHAGGRAAYEHANVALWDDVDALIAKTVARCGRLDVMVNNAAIYSGTPLLETSAAGPFSK